jgi:hypothetical protein
MASKAKNKKPPRAKKKTGMLRSAEIAEGGIQTGRQFAGFMSALMSDIISGKIPPAVGNAACNAGGKLLKVVEMQYRYGHPKKDGKPQELLLTND